MMTLLHFPLALNAPDHFSDREKDAWVCGYSDAMRGTSPQDTLDILNPFDGDKEPLLFDAWEVGFDIA